MKSYSGALLALAACANLVAAAPAEVQRRGMSVLVFTSSCIFPLFSFSTIWTSLLPWSSSFGLDQYHPSLFNFHGIYPNSNLQRSRPTSTTNSNTSPNTLQHPTARITTTPLAPRLPAQKRTALRSKPRIPSPSPSSRSRFFSNDSLFLIYTNCHLAP
jgi:hypothetical protein